MIGNKVLGIMIFLILITSSIILFTSQNNTNEINNKGFGNSTILYDNNTTIIGEIDNIYFSDIYYNYSWHYSLSLTEPAISNIKTQSILTNTVTDTNQSVTYLKFLGNEKGIKNYFPQYYNISVLVTGTTYVSYSVAQSLGIPQVIKYNEYLPFSIENNGQIEANNGFNTGIYFQNLTYTPENYYFIVNNNSLLPLPFDIVYYPNNFYVNTSSFFPTSSNVFAGTIYFNYVFYNYQNIKGKYFLNITDNGNEFQINFNGTTYPYTTHLQLLIPNGTYTYNYTNQNNNNDTYISGSVTISGKNVNLNLAYGILPSFDIQTVLFMTLILLSFLIFARFVRGYLIAYNIIGLIFIYIGYKSNIQYFGIDTILYVVVLLASIIAYKLVIE